MDRILKLRSLLPAAFLLAACLFAAAPPWKDKSMAQWTEEDAKQLLADSPWVKYVTPEPLRDMSPSERREGGDWDEGIGRGVGLAGTGILGPRRAAEAIAHAHAKPRPGMVLVRWESALPVRIAEQKVGETDAPALHGDDYAIAVYGLTPPNRRNLAGELKGLALLRRFTKKDIRPSHVEVLPQDDGTAIVLYLFPRSVEIAKKDGGIEFAAQIGRLFVSQYFYTGEMQVHGELQVLLPAERR